MISSADKSSKLRTFRPWVVIPFVGLAALVLFLFWPRKPAPNAVELSRVDGRSRFLATAHSQRQLPANASVKHRIIFWFEDYHRRHGKKNPAAYSFSAHPTHLASLEGLLNQCMEVSGTEYLIAVEAVGGSVYFGHTNTLNGAQWVAAFEKAIEKSNIYCYDYVTKSSFEDTLVLFREKAGVVKVVPRSKLEDYRKLGLIN